MNEKELLERLELLGLVYARDIEAMREELSMREHQFLRQLKALEREIENAIEARLTTTFEVKQ